MKMYGMLSGPEFLVLQEWLVLMYRRVVVFIVLIVQYFGHVTVGIS